MSFGRSFPKIMSVLCPIQITVTGLSINDIHNKGEGDQGITGTLIKMTCFSDRNPDKGKGLRNCPKVRTPVMDGPDQN